ncbi:MAG TPA: hypothetical protein VIR65_03300 [Rhizorhapis sp.]
MSGTTARPFIGVGIMPDAMTVIPSRAVRRPRPREVPQAALGRIIIRVTSALTPK